MTLKNLGRHQLCWSSGPTTGDAMFRDDKKIEIFSVRGQNRILKDSLKKVLGSGLLQSPQRSHHIIHPHDLKTLFDFQKLNREYEK